MPTVEESITIDRSPEDVWAFLTATDNLPAFESQITRLAQLTDGDVGLGTRYEGATNVLGRKLEWTTEIVEFEPPTRSRTKSVEGKLPVRDHVHLGAGGQRHPVHVPDRGGVRLGRAVREAGRPARGEGAGTHREDEPCEPQGAPRSHRLTRGDDPPEPDPEPGTMPGWFRSRSGT